MNAPQWQEAAIFIEALRVTDEDDFKRRLEFLNAYIYAMKSIAADTQASDCDRNLARKFLDMLDVARGMHAGEAIATLSEASTSADADPCVRAKAARVLRSYIEEIQKQGQDISQPE